MTIEKIKKEIIVERLKFCHLEKKFTKLKLLDDNTYRTGLVLEFDGKTVKFTETSGTNHYNIDDIKEVEI